MKKRVLITLVVALALAATASAAWAGGGPVTKSTGKDAAAMIWEVETLYLGYSTTGHIPGAKGKVNLIQPNGNVDVILGVGMDGLYANSLYTVYFDLDGCGYPGVWHLAGDFWTDGNGHGDWNYTAPAESLLPGDYTWSVLVNRDTSHTVLASYNIEFTIE
jgi:hypothetical protein